MTAGLYQRAFCYLSEAVRVAEGGAGPSSGDQQPAAGVADAHMTLVVFCDQQLRKQEESASGESQEKKKLRHFM